MPTTPVANGEHKADADAKAKAKAEAAAKAAEKAQAEKVLEPLTLAAKAAAGGFVDAQTVLEERHLVLGRCVLAVDEVLTQNPILGLSIAQFCERELPNVSGPVFGSSPAYRGLQAARVAAIDPDAATLSVNALVVAHRVKDRRGAVAKVRKAAEKAAKGGKVTTSLMQAAVDSLYPKDQATSPGPAAGSQAAKAGATAKAAKAGTTRNTVATDELVETPVLAVSGARKGGAKQRVDTILASIDSEGQAMAWSIMLATLKAVDDYGPAAVRFALEGGSTKAKAAAVAAEKAKADAAKAAKAAKAKATRDAKAAAK